MTHDARHPRAPVGALYLKRLYIRHAFSLSLIVLVSFVALASSGPASAASPASLDRRAVDEFVESQLDKHGIPGISLALIQDGDIVYAKGYGTAGNGNSMTPDTPMGIGSTAKPFTAIAILQLVEEGVIVLDEPVQTYLPWFRVTDDEASERITIRHLLHHTSGLSELGYNRVLNPEPTLEQGVRDLRLARLTSPVGTKFQYFNPNYSTLALIVEEVSGETYGTYVREHIFEPLRMTNSYASPNEALEAGMAQGHITLFGFPVARSQPFRRYMLGAGYLVSTARRLESPRHRHGQ